MTDPTMPIELLKSLEDRHFDEGENVDVLLIEAYHAGAALAAAQAEPIRALCAELADAYLRLLEHINNSTRLGYEPSDDPLLLRTRAALARWGRPAQPAPPAEGEVAEMVNYLRGIKSLHCQRAAELLERHAAPVPVPVSERLPEPNTKVLAHYFNDHGNGRTICAMWVPAGSRECTVDDSISEPVEGCWPEGWYELIENWNWEDYGWIAVNEGEVAYWQPLPKWPANTLPLPAPQGGEVEP